MDILTSIRGELTAEAREEALVGQTPFSYEYFQEIMEAPVYLSSGNRCDFKVPRYLGLYLFDHGDDWRRDHWEDRPFRKIYQRAATGLVATVGAGTKLHERFQRRFWRMLFAYYWILPHLAGGVLLQTTKEGHRMWYSICATAHVDRD